MTTDLDRLVQNLGVVTHLVTEGTAFGLLQGSLPALREAVNKVMDDEDTARGQMVRYSALLSPDVLKEIAECDKHADELRVLSGDTPCPHCGGTGWTR